LHVDYLKELPCHWLKTHPKLRITSKWTKI
jgi:hypothetical protein